MASNLPSPSPRRVTLAATQFSCSWNTEENLEQKQEYYRLARPADPAANPVIRRFAALAGELGVVLPISFFESAGNAHFNSVVIADADGSLVGHYRKSHIPDGPGYQEKFYFNPGDTGFQWFPEGARACVLQGAEVLLYPTAIGSEPPNPSYNSYPHWARVMQGHAGANMVPLVASNRIGREEFDGSHITFYGGSFIAGPTGEVVAQAGAPPGALAGGGAHPAPEPAPGFVTATFDLEECRQNRAGWGMFRDRRPDLSPAWRQRGAGDQQGWRRSLATNAAPLDADTSPNTIKRRAQELSSRLQEALKVVDLAAAKARLAALEQQASAGDLWEQRGRAEALLRQITSLKDEVQGPTRRTPPAQELEAFCGQREDLEVAVELMEMEEEAAQAELAAEAAAIAAALDAALDRWETRRLLGGPYDESGAVLTIQAGAGGTEAMDWAEMLERMYLRWAERQGYTTRTLDRAPGEEAGVKSVEIEVQGRFAYGLLAGEKGTHRLVRQSPFNAKAARQTSFAAVEVMPMLGELVDRVELPEADLEISTMRSGGADRRGGERARQPHCRPPARPWSAAAQVETAVRVKHLPSGIAVKCQIERSQALNMARALEMLKARLLVVAQEQQLAEVAEIRGDLVKAEWGQQIRNYVFHPYKQLVKDVRTGRETSDWAAVMDGALDPFIQARGSGASTKL
eukprot:scaffold9.g3255.t1